MTNYLDDDEIPDWARAAAEKAERLGFGVPQPGGGKKFHPNGMVDRAEFVTALDKFGLLPDVPADPDPDPAPDPEPPAGDVPWTIPIVDGVRPDVEVELPEGTLGPRYSQVRPADEVQGLRRDGSQWLLEKDLVDLGFTIDLGPMGLDLGIYRVTDVVCKVPNGQKFHVQGRSPFATLGWFTIDCDDVGAESVFEGKGTIHHGQVLDWSGDLARLGKGDNMEFYDMYARAFLPPKPQFDAKGIHADGIQCHAGDGGPGGGQARLTRFVMDWNDCGSMRNSTGALFTQHSGGMEATDVLILRPGGTKEITEIHGTGRTLIDRVQYIGPQVTNARWGFEAPQTLMRTSRPEVIRRLWGNVPGATLQENVG